MKSKWGLSTGQCPPCPFYVSPSIGHQLPVLVITHLWLFWTSLTRASLQVTATDADSGPFGHLSYSLGAGLGASGSPPFRIDARSGNVCTTRTLDRDQGPSSFDFTVTAVDGVSGQSMDRLGCQSRTLARQSTSDLWLHVLPGRPQVHGVCEGVCVRRK